jgi:O-antigen ligase
VTATAPAVLLPPEPPPPGTQTGRLRAARAARSRRELLPGLVLAFAYAWGLAMARLIDVSEDGKFMMLFGTTFTLVVLVTAFIRPRFYLPLAVAFLPYSKAYALPLVGIQGANLTNLLLLLGPVAVISSRVQGRPGLSLRGTERLVLLFVAVSSLSLLPAFESGAFGVGELLQTYRAWLAPILFFFIARGLVRDREDVGGLLNVVAWTTFLVAANTWKEGLDRSSRGSIDAARVTGLMEQANTMGAFLVYYGLVLLALGVTLRPWRRGLPYLLGFLVAARATLYTFSRAAYVAMAGGAATVLFFANPVLLLVAGGGGTAAMIANPSLIPQSVWERLAGTTEERSLRPGETVERSLDRSTAHRLVLWKGGARLVAEHPLLGVGLGRFPLTIGSYTEYPLKQSDPHDAHNAYLLQAAEMGLPSLFLLLLVYLSWGVHGLRLLRRPRGSIDRRLAIAFLGSLVGVLVSCMLGSRFSDEALIAWFWILAATVLVVRRFREPPRLRLRRPHPRSA